MHVARRADPSKHGLFAPKLADPLAEVTHWHPATGNKGGRNMREWCSCGASIRARRKDVLAWRTDHHCQPKPDDEPDKQGSESRVEHAGDRRYDQEGNDYGGQDVPVYVARIGFQPNA